MALNFRKFEVVDGYLLVNIECGYKKFVINRRLSVKEFNRHLKNTYFSTYVLLTTTLTRIIKKVGKITSILLCFHVDAGSDLDKVLFDKAYPTQAPLSLILKDTKIMRMWTKPSRFGVHRA